VEGVTDIMDIDEAITIGNGESMRVTKVGNLNVRWFRLMARSLQ
jgi:hypothetical protein